ESYSAIGDVRGELGPPELPQRRSRDLTHAMNAANALERQNPIIEGSGDLFGIAGRDREVDHMAEAFVRNGDHSRVRRNGFHDPIEPDEVDRFAADLHEIARSARNAQHPPIDAAE